MGYDRREISFWRESNENRKSVVWAVDDKCMLGYMQDLFILNHKTKLIFDFSVDEMPSSFIRGYNINVVQ